MKFSVMLAKGSGSYRHSAQQSCSAEQKAVDVFASFMITLSKHIIIALLTFCSTELLSQTVSVSATQSNVLYQWVDNPLKIVVENNSCNSLVVKADKGKIKGKGCQYIYVASSDTIDFDVIKVGLKRNGKLHWISETGYRVKELPDPLVEIGGYTGTHFASKNTLLAQPGLSVPVYDGFCSSQNKKIRKLASYSLSIYRGDTLLYNEKCSGNLFSDHSADFIQTKCLAGDKIIFGDFICVLYEKEERKLTQQIKLTLN